MRLIFLLLALVAAATAVPKLQINAGNVDALTKQRDILFLLQQVFQDIPNEELRNVCKDYDFKEYLNDFNDVGAVKYLFVQYKLGHVQRRGVPFTVSISELRKEIAVLTRVFLGAKDYNTFLRISCWARRHLNEAQFVKAFVAAVLQRHDTKDVVVLPALYEVFPYHFFDTRVIRKAQNLRAKSMAKSGSKKVLEIPVDWTTKSWLPKGEDKLTYFTEDIGLNNYYWLFSMGGWLQPRMSQSTDEATTQTGFAECDRCELGRGSLYYYIHQQLLARYKLERLSNGLLPIKNVDFTVARTPFKPRLSYANGLEFAGRHFEMNLMPEKEHLIKTVFLLEKRIKDAIDSGFVISTQGSLLALYDRKGLNLLGNLIEATGRSINPRFYGAIQGVARELLGGSPYTRDFFYPAPSALDISETAVRDPMFYELTERFVQYFKRYQGSLPFYQPNDVREDGVIIEDFKIDRLVTYCDKFKVDIDAATVMTCDKDKDEVEIKAVMDRLNHKPFNYEITVNSKKFIKNAVVRVYFGPKYDFDGRYLDIARNRLDFVELDQFFWDIEEGKTLITRRSIDAPMRSVDFDTKKVLLRKVESGLNSEESFYPYKIAQITGFPERLALPKGRRNGMPIQIVAIISSPKPKTPNYGPIVPEIFQTYDKVDFETLIGDYTTSSKNKMYSRVNSDEKSSEETYTRYSGEKMNRDYVHEKMFKRYERSIDDSRVGTGSGSGMEYKRNFPSGHSSETLDTVDRRASEGKVDYLNDYYKNKHVSEIIGGALSLDGRPLGYPLDRPLAPESLRVSNIKVVDTEVYYEGKDCMF